jgi:hypothetical protein
LATKPSSCGWKVTVYVSVARESCPFLCAHGLLAEHKENRRLSLLLPRQLHPNGRVLPNHFPDLRLIQVKEKECHLGFWGELLYAGATFALAHEAAHVLTGEHLANAAEADERRADDVAFDAAVRCTAWQNRLPLLPVASPIAKTCAAVVAFLFANALRLQIDRVVGGQSPERFAAFQNRATHLEIVAGAQEFPTAERQTVTRLAQLCSEIRELTVGLLDRSFAPEILSASLEIGTKTGLEVLKEQAVFGGVKGV